MAYSTSALDWNDAPTTGSFGRKRPGSQNRNRVPSLNSTGPSCSPGSYDVGEQYSNDRPGRNVS